MNDHVGAGAGESQGRGTANSGRRAQHGRPRSSQLDDGSIAGHRAGAAYDMARESVISGKVVQYSAASTTPPPGAHITLQSSSGTIEVHAGNAKLIAASHISLQAGDVVSVTGENVTFGNSTVFVARVIQKGSQSVAVRSKNGVPLLLTAVDASGKIVSPAGAR